MEIKIHKLYFLLLMFSVWSFSLKGQEAKSLLWKIEGEDLDSPSYLFGTIHLMCPDDFMLSSKTREAIKNCEQVVMELDMDDPAMMGKMQKLAMNDKMKNLSGEIGEEDLKTLNEFFRKHYGSDLSQLGIMKPFTLLSMMLLKSLDCPTPTSSEAKIVELAKSQNKEIKGLETPEFQVAIFDSLGVEEQISWLVEYAEGENAMKEEINNLMAAYKDGDLQKLFELMSSSSQFKGYEEVFLYNRNKAWIDKMSKFAKGTPTFFAVGAGHLVTEQGVINLLKEQGYTVTPVF